MRTSPFKERFEDKIFYSPDGCWYWTGERLKIGYGRTYNDGSHEMAHRASYRLYKGDPAGKLVCHRCDNTLCVNPDHLFLGTHRDNTQDMLRKGRGSKPPIFTYNVDLTGNRYGRLLVLHRHGTISKKTFWVCLCDCGVEKLIEHGHLRCGDTNSCGCLKAEVIRRPRPRKVDDRRINREEPLHPNYTGFSGTTERTPQNE